MSLENYLQNNIPLSEAADYFIRLKGGEKTASVAEFEAALQAMPREERDRLLKEAAAEIPLGVHAQYVKQANMGAAAPLQPPQQLPPTAKGQNMAPTPTMSLPQAGMGMHTKMAAFKRALDELGMVPSKPTPEAQVPTQVSSAQGSMGEPVGIEPEIDPAIAEYIAAEQAGDLAASQAQIDYLRSKLQEATNSAEQTAQLTQQLTEQQAAHDQQLLQMQQQVADAMQQTTAAQDQVLQGQQAAAAMRLAYQQLRGQILQAASTDPPAMSGNDAALAAASTAAGPSNAPAPQAGPAAQAASPGTPGTVAPEGDTTVPAPLAGAAPSMEGAQAAKTTGQMDTPTDAKIPNKEVVAHILPLSLRGRLLPR